MRHEPAVARFRVAAGSFPEFWWSGASSSVRKHPLLTAGLGIAAGVLAIQLLRQPGAMIRWFSRIIGASSAVSSVWRLFGGGDRRE